MFLTLTLFLLLTALMAWCNERWLKLPTAVGITMMSALISVGVLLWHHHVSPLTSFVAWSESWDFDRFLMHGVLCFLLFASALHVDVHALREEKWMIFILSTVGVVLSACISATLLFLVLKTFGVNWSWALCFLFGVIISPTDAVIAADAMKHNPLHPSIKSKIIGESLFNDGTAVVLFSFALAIVFQLPKNAFFESMTSISPIIQWPVFLLWQCIGGIFIGWFVGLLFLYAISTVNQSTVELLLTLACATLSYALAEFVHASAPISVVFAGLAIGYHGRQKAMSDETQIRVFSFWELLDELLNISLFVLIGIQLIHLSSDTPWLLALCAVPIALVARYVSVALPIWGSSFFRQFPPRAISWMTWGGLRGGISLALALSVPSFREAPLLIALTYVVVVFSIVVQGGFILPWLSKRAQ